LHNSNNEFANAFNESVSSSEARFFNPFWNILGKLLSSERTLSKSLPVLNQFASKLLAEKKSNLSKKDTDVLSRFMTLKDENGNLYTDQFLRDTIMNFIIAGKDTTTQTMTWSCYLLAKNPEKEKILLDEINDLFPNQTLDFEKVSKQMPYMRAVIDEDLRLYPPVPGDPKYCTEDNVLPNGFKIYKGQRVAWSAYIMGRLPEFWDCPEEFRPERFIEPEKYNGGKSIDNPYLHIPFQQGKRICLGKEMAFLEISTILTMVLSQFKFEIVKSHPVKILPSATIAAKHGIKMYVSHR